MGNKCYVPLEGGELIDINVPNPAGATDWIYTIPAGYEMSLLLAFYRFTTSAIVGPRYPMFVMYGADNFDRYRIRLSAMAAGQIRNVSLCVGSARDASYSNVTSMDSLPDVRWPAGDQWGSATSGMQVGDQFTIIHLLAVRWRV